MILLRMRNVMKTNPYQSCPHRVRTSSVQIGSRYQPCHAALMRAGVSGQALGVPVPDQLKDALRARILKTMLITIARHQAGKEE